jgi:hypothetical protein
MTSGLRSAEGRIRCGELLAPNLSHVTCSPPDEPAVAGRWSLSSKYQGQTRTSNPGQMKRMTNVLTNVTAIAILTINGEGGVIDFFIRFFVYSD